MNLKKILISLITLLFILSPAVFAAAESEASSPVASWFSKGRNKSKATNKNRNRRGKQHTTPAPEAAQPVEKEPTEAVAESSPDPIIEEGDEYVPVEWNYSAERLDSLLHRLNANNTVSSFEDFFTDFITLDTTEVLTTNIPDSVYEARLRAILSPIGLPFNNIVKQFIISYTTKRKGTMSQILSRSQYYFPIIENELMLNDLPLELKILPVIESALSPTARSKVGATGLWQFMYGTGKSYGLEITTFVDERCDPLASSRAACRFMKDLYAVYGDWTLVIAAYNCGPGNVNKAFKRAGDKAKNYWDIYPYLPRETRGYVPSFIAAMYAYTYHRQHDIEIRQCPIPLATDTLTINRITHLGQISSTLDIPLETIRMLNPQYRKDIIPSIDKPYSLVLPQIEVAKYIDREGEIRGKESAYLSEYLNPANIDKTRQIFASSAITHRVRNGENLGSIARKYGVTVKQIVKWNNLRNPNSLRIGQKLEIHK
jgi:membrane-bound lytic murein transglycosylase D